MDKTIRIAFYNSQKTDTVTTYDKLISGWQKLQHGDKYHMYTHVEMIIDDEVMFSSSPADGGVRFKDFNSESTHWDFVDIFVSENTYNCIRKRMSELLGLKYDWLGIYLSQIVHINVDSQSRWFCSEIIGMLLNNYSYVDLPKEPNQYDVALLAKALDDYGLTFKDHTGKVI